jgi:histidyl-tRNA synthetase
MAEGKVMLKDMVSGEQKSVTPEELVEQLSM